MRILFALPIFLMQASFIGAKPSSPNKIVTCDYARFEAMANISEPSELEIELTGEIFLTAEGMRIVAINTLTYEELWIVADRKSSEISFLYPDTLNGVSKVVAENSPIWTLLDSGFQQSSLSDYPGVDCSEIKAIKIRKIMYPGTRFQTESGGFTDIWWEPEGKPKRLVFQDDSNNAQFDFLGFELGKEVDAELFEIGNEFTLRQAPPEEDLNPFQL